MTGPPDPAPDPAPGPPRRAAANRLNAQASTGPRTPAGKQKAARNAHKHGLAVPSSSIPDFGPEIEADAARLAAGAAPGASPRAALDAAAARLDLRRARAARSSLLSEIGRLLDNPGPADGERRATEIVADVIVDGDGSPDFVMAPAERRGLAMIDRLMWDDTPRRIRQLLAQAARLERYERRAHSRLKTALRDLADAGDGGDE